MKVRWRILLPVCGLMLFSFETYHSFAHPVAPSGRYFWWSGDRLDSDPLGKKTNRAASSCGDVGDGCLSTDPIYIWIDPGWVTKILVLSAIPAFLLGKGLVYVLARQGVSEILSLMLSMPLLIGLWFYCVGWSFDRCRGKRSTPAPVPPW
jgi:hypothetical protein